MLGSAFETIRRTSINLGKSLVCFASTATVTTGSDICTIRSNGSESGSSVTVLPAKASLIPVNATILPALTYSTGILSAPTIKFTCCMRFNLGIPTT